MSAAVVSDDDGDGSELELEAGPSGETGTSIGWGAIPGIKFKALRPKRTKTVATEVGDVAQGRRGDADEEEPSSIDFSTVAVVLDPGFNAISGVIYPSGRHIFLMRRIYSSSSL